MKETSLTNHFGLIVVATLVVAQVTFGQSTTTYEYDSVGNRIDATNVFRVTDTQVFSRQPSSGLPSDRMIILGRNLPPGSGAGISVTIGGLSAPVLAVSTRVISVEVPVGRGTGQVIVTLPDAPPIDLGEFTFLDLSVDADGDCVPDALEPGMGLDPTLVDTDGDGVLDGDEDSDVDGLTNCEEVGLGTNLAHPDSDADGFSDGDEVEFGSDPLDPDSLPIDPGAVNAGEVVGPLIALENLAAPASALGEIFGPFIAIENLAVPASVLGEIFGPFIAIENLAVPASILGEIFGPFIAIENLAVPPSEVDEAMGPVISIENQGNP